MSSPIDRIAAGALKMVRSFSMASTPGLEGLRRELMACGSDLQSTAPFQGRSFFDEYLGELSRLTCRIAFIGR